MAQSNSCCAESCDQKAKRVERKFLQVSYLCREQDSNWLIMNENLYRGVNAVISKWTRTAFRKRLCCKSLLISFLMNFLDILSIFESWPWIDLDLPFKVMRCIFMSPETFWWLFWPFCAFLKIDLEFYLDWTFKVMRWENLYQCQISFCSLQ